MSKQTARKVQPAPFGGPSKSNQKKAPRHPLFQSTPKKFGVGQAIRPKVDMTRYVRWPRYIKIQRQRRVLMQRLKVPPALNQFNCALDRSQTSQIMRLLQKYRPESPEERTARLTAEARKREAGEGPSDGKRKIQMTYGIQDVTKVVESGRAKLVVIAHDVDPLELVCWLPTLCRKKDIPYCIVKGKGTLGMLCYKKTTSCVALENVRKEDINEVDKLCKIVKAQFNENTDLRRKWGGGILGLKSRHRLERRERVAAIEATKKPV